MSRSSCLGMALGFAACLVGCSTTREEPRLPFHLAVARPSISMASSIEDREADALCLSLDVESVSRELRAQLERRFARVTLLDGSPTVEGGGLLAAAAHEGADLVMIPWVFYDSHLTTATNDRFWPNLSLFLLGGPGCYFVDDRSYFGVAQLSAQFHDTAALGAQVGPDSGRGAVLEIDARTTGVSLDFLDRAGLRPWPYLVSLLVPAGFLVPEGDAVSVAVSEKTMQVLAADLARRVDDAADELIRADAVRGFYLHHPVEVLRLDRETVRVRGTVTARSDVIPRMEGYVLRSGDSVVRGTFPVAREEPWSSRPDAHRLVYDLEATLPVAPGASYLELEITTGGRDADTRTYTVLVPEGTGAGS